MINEELFTGAIESPKDDRDYQYSDIGMASIPFDWEKGFDIETIVGKLPVKDQEQTSSCGGFAWASLSYVLDETNREEKSEKFIYAQTHVQGGGSNGRTNCDLCVKKGVCSKSLCPLPKPLVEAEITRTDDITAEAYANALTNKEKSYLRVNYDIESIAQALRDSNGVVMGITGQNNRTWRTAFPLPPSNLPINGFNSWRHWIYVGKAKLIDSKKYLGILNSWGSEIGDSGWQWISEDYFKISTFQEAWAMMYDSQIKEKFVFTKTLRLGSKGIDVKMLQIKLGIKSDGRFGPITQKAVIKFQLENGLKGDSIVGPFTIAKLNQI